ncbi:MAG: terpene cyclase/mutase family protein [Lentisphaerae bacterium]|nr:terpene cyclase/mutase family protein [Lentisphaerota bacterium]
MSTMRGSWLDSTWRRSVGPGSLLWPRPSWSARWRNILHGLKEDPRSGAYKYARLQVLRLLAPASALLFVLLMVLLLSLWHQAPRARPEPLVGLAPQPELEHLDPAPPLAEPTDLQHERADEEWADTLAPMDDVVIDHDVPVAAPARLTTPAPENPRVPVRISIALPALARSRTGEGREQARRHYQGAPESEAAVLLALRWLKQHQEPNGSWRTGSGGGPDQFGGAAPAMTGLALLAFLAHGERPDSAEFGATVERALKWLLANQTTGGAFLGADAHDYSQPIAAYALSEAATLTKIPMVCDAARRAVLRIVQGQNPDGGLWNYNFDPRRDLRADAGQAERNDLSFSAWCLQALKAARIAELAVPGLDDALRRGALGVKRNGMAAEDGTWVFGYTRGQGPFEITSAGVLCLQLLEGGRTRDVQQALRWLERATCRWARPWADNAVYHWYYITQAKFHAGGAEWNAWNRVFARELTGSQVVERQAPGAAAEPDVDVGYWNSPNGKSYCDSRVYNTALCTLMLEVYYRQIATYRAPAEAQEDRPFVGDAAEDIAVLVL